MPQKPGVVFYYDSVDPLVKFLSREQLGDVFAAALEYGKTGALPELDPISQFAFETLRPHIDRDSEQYHEKCRQNKYKRYIGIEKAAGRTPLEYEEWLTVVDHGQHRSTTVTNMNNNNNVNINSKANIKSNAIEYQLEREGEGELEGEAGEGREGTTVDIFYQSGRYMKTVGGNVVPAAEAEIEAYSEMKKQRLRTMMNCE